MPVFWNIQEFVTSPEEKFGFNTGKTETVHTTGPDLDTHPNSKV